MKEININIEGYNVNGICVGCLNYNRKMFYQNEIKECFKLLGNIDVPDGLSIQVCWECLAAVKSVFRFQSQICKAYDVLIAYSEKHTFLNSPKDFAAHAVQKVAVNILDTSLYNIKEQEDSIKEENFEFETLKVEYIENDEKYDENLDKYQEDKEDSQLKSEIEDFTDDFPNNDFMDVLAQDKMSSDDDIQLSQLKIKKKKRHKDRDRKRHKIRDEKRQKIREHRKNRKLKANDLLEKQSRRLKNLPEGLVDLYTMSEEEMLRIRSLDVASEAFQKLKLKCELCVAGFNTRKLMECHMSGRHNPKNSNVYQCDVCKSYFLTKDNVSVHRRLHLAAYKCRECGLITTLKRVMLAHECASRSGECHQCRDCDQAFNSKSKLAYHKSVCHQEKPQCDCCGKVFANKMTLKYHLKIPLQDKDVKTSEKLYIPCQGCSKIFHSKKSYRAHVVIHDGLTYPCPTCGKLFQWKRNLARHARNHRERDSGATHQCRECGKSFASRDCYNNHMRLSKRHAPEDVYVHGCPYCGRKFATKSNMVDHIDWDHLKRIKYQCSVCFKPFKTGKILTAHMNNIHDGKSKKEPEGEHLCDICGKSYKTVKRLKGHVWAMHTKRSDAKSFKCALCPATFAWQTSIYKHMKMMHDNKRAKQSRSAPSVKKSEPYPGIELANRMQYFQQSMSVPPPPLSVVQNNG